MGYTLYYYLMSMYSFVLRSRHPFIHGRKFIEKAVIWGLRHELASPHLSIQLLLTHASCHSRPAQVFSIRPGRRVLLILSNEKYLYTLRYPCIAIVSIMVPNNLPFLKIFLSNILKRKFFELVPTCHISNFDDLDDCNFDDNSKMYGLDINKFDLI